MKAATLWLILAFNAVAISAVSRVFIQLLEFDETTPITTVTLHEDTTAQTSLAIVRCAEEDTATPSVPPVIREDCVCNLDRTVPSNGPFDVWKLNNNNNNNQININVNRDFKAFFVGTAQATSTLDYDTQKTHLIIVRCASPTVTLATSTVTIEVDILPNQQPVITGYPFVTSQLVVGNTANPVGTTIYTVTANDPEGDALEFTMTQNPDNNWLTIGAYDGVIRTAVDTRVITSDYIICTVTVTDGHDNTVNNFVVHARFRNLNTRPFITNLPSSITVTGNQASEFVLKTLTYGDDTPQTNQPALEPDCSMNPVSECHTIIYDSETRQLKLKTITTGQLDTGTTDKYLITCVLFDGYLSSEGDVLTMHAYKCTDQSTEKSLLDDDAFVAFFATSIVLTSLTLLVVIWHVFCRCGKAAKHPPLTQVTPQ